LYNKSYDGSSIIFRVLAETGGNILAREKIGFYSVDVILDKEQKPWLIEINGCNSGFNGFFSAYGNFELQERIISAFNEFAGNRQIYVVTHLATNGEFPPDFLDKLIKDLLFYRGSPKLGLHPGLGTSGMQWNRMRGEKEVGNSNSSIDTFYGHEKFKKVFLNAQDPTYVLPVEYFDEKHIFGAFYLKKNITGSITVPSLSENDIILYRCPSVAYSRQPDCIEINPEYPDEAVADNKFFTYELLKDKFADNIPKYLPVGNLCSGSSKVREFLQSSGGRLFIKKPLAGTKARGIDITLRQDLEDYLRRIEALESMKIQSLPPELKGVPWLLAGGVLGNDLSLLSEVIQSRPVYCRLTERNHFGCIRALLMVKEESFGNRFVKFLGAYWRLAPMPIDSDAFLRERYVGSFSQGSFCEPVSQEETQIVEDFSISVINDFITKLKGFPNDRRQFEGWEENYWSNKYYKECKLLGDKKISESFKKEIEHSRAVLQEAKEKAEKMGFCRNPMNVLSREQVIAGNYAYLIAQPERIVIEK
jgi:hypothetical protein